MKLIVYTLLALGVPLTILAQKDSLNVHHRFLISATIGTTTPTKGFSTYRGDITAGPPKRGISYRGEFIYSPWRFLGVVGAFIRTMNETPDVNAYAIYPAPCHGQGCSGKTISSFYYWANNWITDNALVGVSGQYQIGRVGIKAKALVGWQWIKTPEVIISAAGWEQSPTGYQVWWTRSTYDERMTGQALVYGTGFDIKVNIVKGLGMLAGFDISNSNINLKNNLSQVKKDITYRTWLLGLIYSFK